MKVLGISGSERHAAAALSIDGVVVAAAAEESFARVPQIGYRATGGYPLAAIDACLTRAAVDLPDVDRIVVVDDQWPGRAAIVSESVENAGARWAGEGHGKLARALKARSFDYLDALQADARQLDAVSGDEDLAVCVLAPQERTSVAFERRRGAWLPVSGFGGAEPLFAAAGRVAEAVGLGEGAPYDALERFGADATPGQPAAFERALTWDPVRGVLLDHELLCSALAALPGGAASVEAERSLNVRVQEERQAIAAGFCRRVNALIEEMAHSLSSRTGIDRVGFAGGLLSSRGLVAALSRAFGERICLPPVPELPGRALGAALGAGSSRGNRLQSLALGPQFSEAEIKETLENCRLDYLYEPQWQKLTTRISGMLARGSVVAWFQGPAGFGPRAVGTRSVLCDPSNRYARENVNRYLRRVPVDDPVPVAMTEAAIGACVEPPAGSAFLGTDSVVKPEWRDRLRSALNGRNSALVQMVTGDQSEALADLLAVHAELTGVPGLMQANLAGEGEPIAVTPRDAVRTMFSSAIDALVIGRFLLMKDYWLLRSGTNLGQGR